MLGGCLEGFVRLSEGCGEFVWMVCGDCPEGVERISGRCGGGGVGECG